MSRRRLRGETKKEETPLPACFLLRRPTPTNSPFCPKSTLAWGEGTRDPHSNPFTTTNLPWLWFRLNAQFFFSSAHTHEL